MEYTCVATGKVVESVKLPFRWKEILGKTYSPEGYQLSFCTRGITIQVASVEAVIPNGLKPKEREQLEKSTPWAMLNKHLSVSFRQVMQIGNWVGFRLAAMEPFRPRTTGLAGTPVKDKLPKHPITRNEVNRKLCAEMRECFPDIDSQSLYQAYNVAKSAYLSDRFGVLIMGNDSIHTFRFPMPLPIPASTFASYSEPWLFDGDRLGMSLRIAGMRFKAWLCNKPRDWGKQIELFRKCALGELEHGALSIRRNKKKQVMITLAIHLPRESSPRDATEAMIVRTHPGHLLVGEMHGRNAFIINDDHVVCRHLNYLGFVQRLSEDRKAERRGQAGYTEEDTARCRRQHRRNIQRASDRRHDKHADFMRDALHKIACIVVNHAVRRRVFTVVYDDTCKERCEKFPWAMLRGMIGDKLGRRDIIFKPPVEQESGAADVASEGKEGD